MIDRIKRNEERLDSILNSIKELEMAIKNFKSNKKNISLVNRYYGSKEWFLDKEVLENKEISGVKAGVLSEDLVWNMNEDIRDLINDMQLIIDSYPGF